jgi:hypothetical protein
MWDDDLDDELEHSEAVKQTWSKSTGQRTKAKQERNVFETAWLTAWGTGQPLPLAPGLPDPAWIPPWREIICQWWKLTNLKSPYRFTPSPPLSGGYPF